MRPGVPSLDEPAGNHFSLGEPGVNEITNILDRVSVIGKVSEQISDDKTDKLDHQETGEHDIDHDTTRIVQVQILVTKTREDVPNFSQNQNYFEGIPNVQQRVSCKNQLAGITAAILNLSLGGTEEPRSEIYEKKGEK